MTITIITKFVENVGTLYRVKKYSEMLQYYDLADIQPDVPMADRSNFGYVQTWIPGLGTGSVSIFTNINAGDIDGLHQMQTNQENTTAEQKMNFLVYPGRYVRPCWTNDTEVGWDTATNVRVGACIFTNQLVMVDRIENMMVKVPNQGIDAIMSMGRLVCFKNTDWDKTFQTHPWLIHHVTGVRQDNIHNEFPFGEVFLPLFDPQDFNVTPTSTDPNFRREFWAYMDTIIKI